MNAQPICGELERASAAGAPIRELLARAVEPLHSFHRQSHWTGIYELYPDRLLRLGPCIGVPTRRTRLAMGEGVCGAAVAARSSRIVPELDASSDPALSSARSALVAVIRNDDTVFGSIVLESQDPHAFDERALEEVQAVADWLAGVYAHVPRFAPEESFAP